jgi:predicted permease
VKGLTRFVTRLCNIVTRRRTEERLREELESHLLAQTEENIRAGMTPAEARRQAGIKLGSREAVRQGYQAETGLPFFEDLLTDIRYALRVLWRSRGFTLVVVATLMLAIGANVAVFGVLNALLLRPLEVRDPENLYQLRLKQWTSFKLVTTSYPAFEDFRQRNTSFTDMAGYNGYAEAKLGWRNSVTPVLGGYSVTANYFDLLGVQPEVGRFFQATDEQGARYVVLSHALWRRVFDADPAIVGATVRLDNEPYTVVGVAPAAFHGTEKLRWPDYWIPLVNRGEASLRRDQRSVTVLGRLKPGVTPEQAAENLNAIATHMAQAYPETDSPLPLKLVRPGLYADIGDVIRGFLRGLMALALLVLMAACANLGSLFAARAADRRRELALRMSLGASPGRLVRQLMTEAMVVAMLGGTMGLLAAGLALRALDRWQSPYGHAAIHVDTRVYLVALAFALVSALLFGMIPARQVWGSHPLQAMKNGPLAPRPRRGFALRDLVLGAQIAICMVLVMASLVAFRGMERMLQPAHLGFQPQGAMLAPVELSPAEPGGVVPLEKKKALIEAVRSVPGVEAVGTVSTLPAIGSRRGVPVFVSGTTELKLSDAVLAPYVFTISPGYLQAAGTRLLRGRDVSWQDTAESPQVAIVNQTFARRMWGDAPAIGRRFLLQRDDTEVVGVAEDGKYQSMQESPQPAVYLSLSQREERRVIVVVRSPRAMAEMATSLERTLRQLEPNAEIRVRSWCDALGPVLFPARAAALSLGVLGLFGALLAVTGIFGIAAHNVSRRMKELGIRVALGADARWVMSAAVGRPIRLLGMGSAVGLLLGAFARRLLGQIVYQANPMDPVVLAGAVLTMALLGMAASAIPALRALGVDPARLMREE